MQFDGKTYDEKRDQDRLSRQYKRVFELMKDGEWRTLRAVAEVLEDPESSIGARLRDMRKDRFGGHTVLRQYLMAGVFKYRLVLNPIAAAEEVAAE
jgi:hypothetical protein